MLRGLHKASSHWLGKLVMAGLFGFLALSFAVWGIGDIFRGFGRSSLAKIGSTEIGIEQFRHAYNEHLQQLGRRLGRKPALVNMARSMRRASPRQPGGRDRVNVCVTSRPLPGAAKRSSSPR